jgi:hypothetical protein
MTRVKTQWVVFHLCGHRFEHDLTKYEPKARAGRATWLATKDCTQCWLAAKATAAAAVAPGPVVSAGATVVANTWVQVRPLPPLEGTAKQVAWATKIRGEMVDRLWQCSRSTGEDPDEFIHYIERPVKMLHQAGFWIDHRDVHLDDLEQMLRSAAVDSDEA